MLVAAVAAVLCGPVVVGVVMAPVAAAQGTAATAVPTPLEIMQRRDEQAEPRTAVPFKPEDFDKFSGYYISYYWLPSPTIMRLLRSGNHYFLQRLQPHTPPIEIYPDSQYEFFFMDRPIQLSFEESANGRGTILVVHQGGLLIANSKASTRAAQAALKEMRDRIKQDKPSPGTEGALRKYIEAVEANHPDYADMIPNGAALARLQQSETMREIQGAGALKNLRFTKVLDNGADLYLATFTHAKLLAVIPPLAPSGKIVMLHIAPAPFVDRTAK